MARQHNYRTIRLLKHELRALEKANEELEHQLDITINQRDNLVKSEYQMREACATNEDTIEKAHSEIHRLEQQQLDLSQELSEVIEHRDLARNQVRDAMKNIDQLADRLEYTERHLKEQTDKLINIADALARSL